MPYLEYNMDDSLSDILSCGTILASSAPLLVQTTPLSPLRCRLCVPRSKLWHKSASLDSSGPGRTRRTGKGFALDLP